MKILAVSDVELDYIYSPSIKKRFSDVDLLISCGDLSYTYQEYMISMLDRTLYYVRGNHAPRFEEETSAGVRTHPWGGTDLHEQVIRDPSGLLLAGFEGSLRYNVGRFQYTQSQMWEKALGMVPRLIFNKLRYGRYLDILVTHAPPWQIHDDTDLPHQGIKAFRWLLQVFQPALHLHGHIHVYRPDVVTKTQFGKTWIMNVYGHRIIEIELPQGQKPLQLKPEDP